MPLGRDIEACEVDLPPEPIYDKNTPQKFCDMYAKTKAHVYSNAMPFMPACVRYTRRRELSHLLSAGVGSRARGDSAG